MPGAYGMFNLMESPLPVLPPAIPAHMHLVVYGAKHNVFATKLYFGQNDTQVSSFRIDLAPEESRNVLTVTLNGKHWVADGIDFVLTPNASVVGDNPNRDIVDQLCSPERPADNSLMLCSPGMTWVLEYAAHLITVALAIVSYFVLRKMWRCVSGSSPSKVSSKPKKD
jgi:hypothetical protein